MRFFMLYTMVMSKTPKYALKRSFFNISLPMFYIILLSSFFWVFSYFPYVVGRRAPEGVTLDLSQTRPIQPQQKLSTYEDFN